MLHPFGPAAEGLGYALGFQSPLSKQLCLNSQKTNRLYLRYLHAFMFSPKVASSQGNANKN